MYIKVLFADHQICAGFMEVICGAHSSICEFVFENLII